ncbi:MAG: hypothetical protein Q9191_004902 [Dirinaria sp. TL-2023a]
MRQALYDGAFEARGIYHTRANGAGNELDGKAYTFSATYASGGVKLYAHFVTQPDGPNTALHYHMCPIGGGMVDNSAKDFRAGVTAFRNLRDLAYRMRTKFADAAEFRLRAQNESEQSNPSSAAQVQKFMRFPYQNPARPVPRHHSLRLPPLSKKLMYQKRNVSEDLRKQRMSVRLKER